jgi:hypothetical protein
MRVLTLRQSILSGLFAAIFLIAQACTGASAETRVALVIGNGAYKNAGLLKNPRNDATDVAASLNRMGFKTIVGLDLDKAAMEDIEIRFDRAARDADVAMFYYSGHAIQYAGANYLLPTDAQISDAADLRRLARVDDVVADLQQAKGLRILVLDSCRDNPLADELKRSLGITRSALVERGLARINSPQGMIIAYSTQAGQTADDGQGRNSPYTSAFLEQIEKPAEIGTIFQRITIEVFRSTPKKQLPELSLSLTDEYYLNGGSASAPPPVAVNAGTLANLQPAPPATLDQPDDNTELKDTKLLFEVRERLYALNFDPGPLGGGRPDLTRTAIAQFARATSTPLRDEPTYGLLRKLRAIDGPKPWGAIVYAEGVNVWGMSWAEASRKDAVAHAAASCGSNAAACVAETSFFGNGCAAFAHSKKAWALVARSNVAKAKSDALEECSRKGSGCNIIASVCADGTEQFTAK